MPRRREREGREGLRARIRSRGRLFVTGALSQTGTRQSLHPGKPAEKTMRPREASEEGVRTSLQTGDASGAVRAALELYGPEVFGFVCGVVVDLDAAEELYADVVRRIATEVAKFQWRCSLRTWTYWIARRE